jgi:hypothetical protein
LAIPRGAFALKKEDKKRKNKIFIERMNREIYVFGHIKNGAYIQL